MTNKEKTIRGLTVEFKTIQEEIGHNIRKTIRGLKRQGTTGMGIKNLFMVTPTPRVHACAPSAYQRIFNEVAWEVAKGFVYAQD